MLKALNRYFAKHGRATFIAILILIVGPFVFLFGSNLDGISQGSLFHGTEYGKIFGRTIDQDEFLLHMYGQYLASFESFDHMEVVASQMARERHKFAQQSMDMILTRMRILHEAKKQGFAHVTDEQLREAFREFPLFQENGEFSRIKYATFRNNYLPRMFFNMANFEQMMRETIVLQRYARRFMNTTVTAPEARAIFLQNSITPRYQTHEIVKYDVKPTDIKISEEEIRQVYEAGRQEGGAYFINPTRSLRVAVFKASYEPPDIEVSDEQIQAVYEDERNERYVEEQVKVRHILIQSQPDNEESKIAALTKIQDLLNRVRAGEDFAELAREHSEDPGSKDKGGLYDFFGRDRMVAPFTKAAFSLKKEEVSEPVETQYGYHIIKKLDERIHTIPLETAELGIRRRLRQEGLDALDDKAAKKLYNKELALDLNRPEALRKYIQKQYHFLHILVENSADSSEDDIKLNREKAEKIHRLAVDAEDFKLIAQKHSDADTRAEGGDMGWIPQSMLDRYPQLNEAINLEAGTISDVIEDPRGFHIVKKVAEKTEAVPFETIRSQVLSELRTERDREIKEAAENAAKAFAAKAFNASVGKSFGEVKVAFEKLITEEKVQAVTSTYFDKNANQIPGIQDRVSTLISAAQDLTPTAALTGSIALPRHFVVACLNGTKPGRIPALNEVKAMVESDLRQAKQLAEARRQANEMLGEIKAQLEEGTPFKSLPQAQRFRPYRDLDNPYYQDPRKEQFVTAAQRTGAGDVTIINTEDGAALIYVDEQELPSAESFEKVAAGLKSMLQQNKALTIQESYLKELESRYPFAPNPGRAEIFSPGQEQ